MKDFQGYRQKKNNEFAQQKGQRLELRNGKKYLIPVLVKNIVFLIGVLIGCQADS